MGSKDNPGKFDCYNAAESDEPMFVLLARDPMAPALVRLWADARELAAKADRDLAKVDEARKCAADMDRWHGDHPDHGFLARRG
jgi:hypothetical protein